MDTDITDDRFLTAKMLIITALFLGCGSHHQSINEPSTKKVADLPDREKLAQRMVSIGERLREEGFISIPWSYEGSISKDRSVRFRWRPGIEARLVVVVIGNSRSLNLDMTVHNLKGKTETEDTSGDHRAAVEITSSARGIYSLRVDTRSGRGKFRMGVFVASPSEKSAPLAGIFDADPVQVRSWAEVDLLASGRGYEVLEEPLTFFAARHERSSFEINLVEGRCYLVAAVGAGGIDTLAMRLLIDGIVEASDLSERSQAWVGYCAERDARASLALEVIAGSGQLKMGSFHSRREDVIPSVGPPLEPADPPTSLHAAVRRNEEILRESGYDLGELLHRGRIAAGDRLAFTFDTQSKGCFVVSAIAPEEIRDISLKIRPADGAFVQARRSSRFTSRTPMCCNGAESYDVELVALSGEGEVEVWMNRLPIVELPVKAGEPPFPLMEAAARFAGVSLHPREELSMEPQGDRTRWKAVTHLEKGRCMGVAAATHTERITLLQLKENGASGESRQWKGPSILATLAFCPERSGDYTISLTTENNVPHPGPTVVIFAAPDLKDSD